MLEGRGRYHTRALRKEYQGHLWPDKGDVAELLFTQALIYPKSSTDYHTHDRPELIYVVSGRGMARSSEGETPICADMAIWAEADELHQIINTGDETLKLVTVFVPPYTTKQNYDRCLEAARKAREQGGE
jgi:mannose-6-phosphate isomerase-like protein (cupin superfamily)